MPKACAHQTQRKNELRRVIARVQGAKGALARAVEAAADMTARAVEAAVEAATDRTAPGDVAATAATARTETAAGTFFASTTSVAIADMATDASSPMTQEADDIKLCMHKNVSRIYFNINNFLGIALTRLRNHNGFYFRRYDVDTSFLFLQNEGHFNITSFYSLKAFSPTTHTIKRTSFRCQNEPH